MKYPAFAAIVGQRFYNLPKGPGHHQYWWTNTDRLIGSYPGADGIKDGYTDDAGHCLLFEAVRNGRTLIGVVLDSPATGVAAGAQDAAKMLNWGFALPPAPRLEPGRAEVITGCLPPGGAVSRPGGRIVVTGGGQCSRRPGEITGTGHEIGGRAR